MQIGVFPLPMHCYQTYYGASILHFKEYRHHEMLWFGGLGTELLDIVHHCSLDLDYKIVGGQVAKIERARIRFSKLFTSEGLEVKMLQPDRFFYNQVFFLLRPT